MDDLGTRQMAAMRAGLSSELAPRLQGSTPEELEADARELARLINDTPKQQPDSVRALLLAKKQAANARNRRIFGDGDTWKEVGDEQAE